MPVITPKGILLGILLALIATLSTAGIFLLYQKKQPSEKLKTNTSEALQTRASHPDVVVD